MPPLRLGIAGAGNMGATHARTIQSGRIPGVELAALADRNADRLAPFSGARHFADPETMLRSGTIDAALIVTPHFSHVPLGILALEAGLHVMVEKPIAAHKADAERLIAAAAARPRQVCAAMFNQRTDDFYRKIRELIRSGGLGEIRRMNWTITNWFRPEIYYASSAWRATWAGEGGGVLINQSVHNLDMILWLFGPVTRVRAHAGFGRFHDIEVEDDVTAYLEFANGATGVFVTSTGESPGTNRLEIVGELGRLVLENDVIKLTRNAQATSEFSRTSSEPFGRPETREETLTAAGHGGQHEELLRNFVAAIREGTPLIAPVGEGIHSIELVNALLLSAWTDQTVTLPLDSAVYARALDEKVRASRPKKKVQRIAPPDMTKSFGR
jgi:predicted dehydrogenase